MNPTRHTEPSTRRRPARVYRRVVDTVCRGRRVRWADRLLITGFLAAISTPVLAMLLGLDAGTNLHENRQRVRPPSWPRNLRTLSAFPRRFESFFNDSFGFRETLIQWLSRAEVEGLGVSSSPQVIIGREGWLFFAGLGAREYLRATEPFRPEHLERWSRMFQERHDWLASRGIRYLVVIVPNKATIYPEYLPASANRVGHRSRFDEILEHLNLHTDVQILDMRASFLREKTKEQLYYRTDTHWNGRGAYLGSVEIVRALSAWFPAMKPRPRSDYESVSIPHPGFDLAGILGLSDRLVDTADELVDRAAPVVQRLPLECRMPRGSTELQRPFAIEHEAPGLPRGVLFHDSFNVALAQFLPEHFRRLACVWKYTLDREVIEREHPDVVIQELVERSLMWNLPEFRDDDKPNLTQVWLGPDRRDQSSRSR